MITLLERYRIARCLALLALGALTLAIYAGGLHGPFLIDDVPNLETLQRWVEHRLDWRSAIDNRSGPLGRSVSMLTFLADTARIGHLDATAFKTTNLLIHVLCGVLVYVLCRQLFRRVAATRDMASATALFVAAWWLFLPLHVSTVLYIVQRMAQLGALFTLMSLLTYTGVRQWMERRPAALLPKLALWIAFPATVLVGAFAKENAVLAMPLAWLIEIIFFPQTPVSHRPRSVVAFFGLTVALPGILAILWLFIHPGFILGGYLTRPFTFTERLLTEPRVLWSYVRTMLLPVGSDMGLFHDNYPLSSSLLSPWTTLPALLGWIAAIVTALMSRRRYPLVAFGIGFFLIGHLLESTIIPLEIYFEHRNYLPDLGILVALVGIARAMWQRFRAPTITFRRLVMACLPLALAIYAMATWVQAGSWGNEDTLFAMQEAYTPESPRLQAILAAREVERGNLDGALKHLELSESLGPDSERMAATLWRFVAYCTTHTPLPDALYDEFARRTQLPITLNAMRYWEQVAAFAESGCVDAKRLVSAGRQWITNDPVPASAQLKWRSLYNLARMNAAAGHLELAEADAHKAWLDSDRNTGIGVLLFQIAATLNHRELCETVLADLRQHANAGNADLADAVRLFTQALADGKIGTPAAPR